MTHPSFPSTFPMSVATLLADFGRLAGSEGPELPEAFRVRLGSDLATPDRALGEKVAVGAFGPHFIALNGRIQDGSAWRLFNVAEGGSVVHRWLRTTEAEVTELERAKTHLSTRRAAKNGLIRLAAAAAFYVGLYQCSVHESAPAYVATGLAAAVYVAARLKLPVKVSPEL